MEEIEHRGYKIKTDSYQDKNTQKWVPRAFIIPVEESPSPEMPMSWEREFGTQLEADDFALEGAQLYIDNHF